MKILLVEDDENKQSRIVRFLREHIATAEVVLAASYVSAIDKILKKTCDVILLDMTIPTYDVDVDDEGGRPRVFGGRDILRQMERRKVYLPVIVITQFEKFGDERESKSRDELNRELAAAHPRQYRGMVYYSAAVEGWKEELAKRLEDLRS
jgi:CheY-like chemotaxis protein